MHLSIVAAVAANGVIGRNGTLPWHIPADLQRFKQMTMHKPIIMGRKTHDSIGRKLSGRVNIVVTRSLREGETKIRNGLYYVSSLKEALEWSEVLGFNDAAVIGGAELYRLALPLADRMMLTRLHRPYAGDVYFPDFDPSQWVETHCEDFPTEGYTFVTLKRA